MKLLVLGMDWKYNLKEERRPVKGLILKWNQATPVAMRMKGKTKRYLKGEMSRSLWPVGVEVAWTGKWNDRDRWLILHYLFYRWQRQTNASRSSLSPVFVFHGTASLTFLDHWQSVFTVHYITIASMTIFLISRC
jgi:hypothetical protein